MIRIAEELFEAIDNYFLDKGKLDYYHLFAHSGKNERGESTGQQLEGWFKGELMYLFSTLQQKHQLREWKSEAKESGVRGAIDFKMHVDQELLYLEVKAVYLGIQGTSSFSPAFYLSAGKNAGEVASDARKLRALSPRARRFCLLFVYPSPASPEVKRHKQWYPWEKCLTGFRRAREAEGIQVEDKTPYRPEQNERLYIARLEISRLSQELTFRLL